MGFHVEVNFAGFPLLADLCQQGGDEAQDGGFVGKKPGDARAAFDFLIHAFHRIGGAKFFLVFDRQGENGEALGQIFLHPRGKFRGAFGVKEDDFLESDFGGGATEAVKDAAYGAGDFGALIEAGHIGLGVLLEVKLAALPGNAGEDGGPGGLEAEVIVAGDELDAAETALNEALKEGPPVDLGLAERDADTEQAALAIGGDAHGHEHGAIEQLTAEADFFRAGIDDEIREFAEGAVAPFLEFGIEEFGAIADLGGTDGGAAEFFDDGGDAACGDALEIHFGEGEFEGAL